MSWSDQPEPEPASGVRDDELPRVDDLIELGPDAGLGFDTQPFAFRVEQVTTAGPDWLCIAGKMSDDGPRQSYRVRREGIRFVERAG